MNPKEEIRNSVEIRYNKNQALFFLIVDIFISVLSFILLAPSIGFTSTIFPIALFNLIFLPFIAFYVYRIVHINKNYHNYLFQEVLFNEPHTSFNRSMFFTIKVKDENGKIIKKDTRAIFQSAYAIITPTFDDYVNKKVLVGYNPKFDEVVVIRII